MNLLVAALIVVHCDTMQVSRDLVHWRNMNGHTAVEDDPYDFYRLKSSWRHDYACGGSAAPPDSVTFGEVWWSLAMEGGQYHRIRLSKGMQRAFIKWMR